VRYCLLLLAALLLAACGAKGNDTSSGDAAASASAGGELTPFQVKNGIGPITEEVTLGPLDKDMAERGEDIFDLKCSSCHKLDQRYVGPALGDVLTRRTPTYVMNMIMAPDTMYTRHPEARALLAQYATQMPNLHLSREDARAIVEHIRKEAADHD
jgi:mono/diheme cytochrome c family protein